jgi:hypothetical protein
LEILFSLFTFASLSKHQNNKTMTNEQFLNDCLNNAKKIAAGTAKNKRTFVYINNFGEIATRNYEYGVAVEMRAPHFVIFEKRTIRDVKSIISRNLNILLSQI